MQGLAEKIENADVPIGGLAISWLGQAGFVYKTPGDQVIYIDPYLTDCVERLFGFKRLIDAPIEIQDVRADCILCTHAHADHMDVDAIPVLMNNSQTRLVGAPDCQKKYAALGLAPGRFDALREGKTLNYRGFELTGIYADHGHLAPDALGVILSIGDIRVWHVGDTAYRPDKWQTLFDSGIDIIVPPINGAYGNLDAVEAAKLAAASRAPVAIPCHYGMFAEHNGDPAQFVRACKQHAPDVMPLLMMPGELIGCSKGLRQERVVFSPLD